jgi:hypothetical protein
MLAYPAGSCELECTHAPVRDFYLRLAARLGSAARVLVVAYWPFIGKIPMLLTEELELRAEECPQWCGAVKAWVLFVLVSASGCFCSFVKAWVVFVLGSTPRSCCSARVVQRQHSLWTPTTAPVPPSVVGTLAHP